MKRFLAIFAMIAMIVSMFSGVAFATEPTKVYLRVDNNILDYSNSYHTVTLSGKIFNSSSNALQRINAEIKIYKESVHADNLVETVTADNGVFSVLLQPAAEKNGVANYIVVGTNNDSEYIFEINNAAEAQDKFTIVNKTELAMPEVFEYTYPVTGQVEVHGVFANKDAQKDDTITLAYLSNPSAAIATASFNDENEFAFLFSGDALSKVGKIGVFINGVLAVEGEVKSKSLDVTATDYITTGLNLDETIVFDFNIESALIDSTDDCLVDGHVLKVTKITKPDGTEVSVNDVLVTDDDATVSTFTNTATQTVNYTVSTTTYSAAGDYTFTVSLIDGDGSGEVLATKEVEVEFKKPSSYNLISWNSSDLTIGEKTFDFGTDILVKNKNNTTLDKIEVIYEGAGLEKTTVRSDEYDPANGVESFKVKPTKTGTLKVTINVYKDTITNDTTPDHVFTRELKVKGWNVTVSPSQVLVDTVNTFTVTITDEAGNPVNNADIEFEIGGVVVSSASTNIVGGQYIYEDVKFTAVDTIDVMANKSGEAAHQVTLKDAVKVIGEEVYTVTSDVSTLLNDQKQVIYLTVLDENNDVVYPNIERIDITSVNGVNKEEAGVTPVIITRKDLDKDGINEAVKIEVTPTEDQHAMILRATYDGGKKMGQIELDVKKPQVVFTKNTKLTENFNTELKFTVIDPRDNSVMTDAVELKVEYLASGSLTEVDDKNLTADDDSVWAVTAIAKGIDWDAAEKAEKSVEAKLVMGSVVLQKIAIEKPSLTATPDTVVINNATNITLTYVDANGNALVEREVKLNDNSIGETNEDGKVLYAASAPNSLALEFNAETDVDNVKTTLKVKSTADTIAPVITAPETVTGNKVTITVKDNIAVKLLAINDKPVELFFPAPEVNHTVNVKPGKNTIKVQALDKYDNYTETTLVVTVKESAEPVEFTIGKDTKYGTPVLKNDVTMVPVRFAQDLGATVDWNNETRTVTYYLGDKKIAMTLGSKTAIVNGVNTQVVVAPYLNEAGRTMVPLRMIAQELGFSVNWTSNTAPIVIK